MRTLQVHVFVSSMRRGVDQDVDALQRLDAADEQDDALVVSQAEGVARRLPCPWAEAVEVDAAGG